MKRHGNYPTVKSNEEIKECLGEYYTTEYANELIQKAKKHAHNDKKNKEKHKKRSNRYKF